MMMTLTLCMISLQCSWRQGVRLLPQGCPGCESNPVKNIRMLAIMFPVASVNLTHDLRL